MVNSLKVIFYPRTAEEIIGKAIRRIRELDCVFAIDVSGLENKTKEKMGQLVKERSR